VVTGARGGDGRQQVIVLWAVPRSVSTAFEKTFSRRADTAVVHEPFTDCYFFSRERRSGRYGDQPHKLGYDGAAAVAAIRSQRSPLVFVKDMSFQAEPFVPQDFLASASNTFILRHPSAVLASLTPLKPDFTEEEFGYLALQRLWRRVLAELGRPPVVVEGDRFRSAPEGVLRQYCARLGVDFHPTMLHWPDGRIRRWGEDERLSQAVWHRTLEATTGVVPPRRREPLPVGPDRTAAYRRALEIYEAISSHALMPTLR
jgi:hypothetical protein